MQIENYSILEVFPYPKNNRKHSEKQIERIADSIKKFGFNQPLVIDELNEILVGHGRLEAAKILHLDSVPCIKIQNLSENEKRAYRILDNKLQNDSEWNFESLQDEIKFLSENDFDISFCGLNELSELFPVEEQEIIEDDFEVDENTSTLIKLGDIVELGDHRLMCGDSTNAEQVAELMQGKQADMVLADPPYGIEWNTDYTRFKGGKVKSQKFDKIKNDEFNFNPSLYLGLAENCVLFGANCFSDKLPIGNWLVWDKRHESGKSWLADAEVAWCNGTGAVHIITETSQGFVSSEKERFHPTQKPVRLFCKILIRYEAAKTVLDPFLGSGTTLIACEQLGRICYGMEISPKYCQVIIDRYHNYCEKNNKEFVCKINGEPYHG